MSRAGVPPVLKDIDHGVSQPVAQYCDFEYEFQLQIQQRKELFEVIKKSTRIRKNYSF